LGGRGDCLSRSKIRTPNPPLSLEEKMLHEVMNVNCNREENWFSAICDVSVSHPCPPGSSGQLTEFDKAIKRYIDKKEKKIFLIYREVQIGAVAKSYMMKGFQIKDEMRKYLVMYEEAVGHI
jgi:hypothetical protein